MQKTLYVSDLDGTLLRSSQTTSEYTNSVINELTDRGILFSYATARSIYTAKVVTKGLDAKIPIIVYNGVSIIDNQSLDVIDANYFDDEVYLLLEEMFDAGIYPIVYAMIEGKERFSYLPAGVSKGLLDFVETRNDIRKRIVDTKAELTLGELFYITSIDSPEKLKPFYDKYRSKYHCVYQKDIYSGEQWLEIMPKEATKANAVKKLKSILGCDYVVAFGDGINDIEMFELADEAYAMANAVPELKAAATGVIDDNDNDGVARWIEENVLQ